jgi:predicted cupin superfamily sugar epimerase/mannose-6-phosphate isomerase-like protein (cupin superfamily)
MKRPCALLLLLSSAVLSSSLSAAPGPTAQALIDYFKMTQVPQEGPWFTLTYSSDDVLPRAALPDRYDGGRAAGSAIIGLLTRTDFSAMHRLKTDEMWHYYGGDALRLLVLHPDGHGEVVVLGPEVLGGQKLQYVVPRGSWQGAMPTGTGADAYSIFGDTLAPAFAYTDFEMGYRSELQRAYPQFADTIAQLTRKEFVTRPASSVPAQATGPGGEPPLLFDVDQMKSVQASLGFQLTEVVGRAAPAHSERCSIAYFSLEAGHSSATSFNKAAEEYFVIARGTGTVRVGTREITVAPGSVVTVPPRAEHSLRAAASNTLYFYAISAPAFSPDDYVAVSAPMNSH